jgi:branched-chain amino acid transport system permease protein
LGTTGGRRSGLIVAAVVIVVLLAAPPFLSRYSVYVVSLWAVMAIAAMGLNLTLGYAGQISMAQAAFVGLGAYTTAILTADGWPFIVGFVLSAILSFVVGWLLGYPALKVRHHYLAFVTLGFTTLAFLFFRNEEWLTGGVNGISGIERPSIFGLPTRSGVAFCYFCYAMLALVATGVWWIVRSPWGRAFIALRENPVRAASLGIDTRQYTLMAFAIGSALGGIAGSVYAPLVQYIDPVPFSLTLSFNILLMVVVGGAGYFAGPLIGAFVAVILPEMTRFAEGYYLILYATLVMVLMAFAPTGLLGLLNRWARARDTRRASALRAATAATFTVGDAP